MRSQASIENIIYVNLIYIFLLKIDKCEYIISLEFLIIVSVWIRSSWNSENFRTWNEIEANTIRLNIKAPSRFYTAYFPLAASDKQF